MIVNTLNSTTGVPGRGDWVGLCGIIEDRVSQIPQFLKAVQALVSLDRVLVEVGRVIVVGSNTISPADVSVLLVKS